MFYIFIFKEISRSMHLMDVESVWLNESQIARAAEAGGKALFRVELPGVPKRREGSIAEKESGVL